MNEEQLKHENEQLKRRIQELETAVAALEGLERLYQEAEATIQKQAEALKEANAVLEQQAQTDGLTGLFNRRAFHAQLEAEIERLKRYQHPLSLLMLDADHFKSFNDDFGHQVGDRVLQTLAEVMQMISRQTDFPARYGGEEFVLLLPDTDSLGAILLAERVRMEVESWNWGHRTVTVSIGAATLDLKQHSELLGDKPDAWLIAEADRALYHAKETGRNRVCHAEALAPIAIPLEIKV
jgi:diguanylate cyclase (GGDEF)-like protein